MRTFLIKFFFCIQKSKKGIQRISDLWGSLDWDDFAFLQLVMIIHYFIQLLLIELHLLVESFDFCSNFLLNHLFSILAQKLVSEGELQESVWVLFWNLYHKITVFLDYYEYLFCLEQFQATTVFVWAQQANKFKIFIKFWIYLF